MAFDKVAASPDTRAVISALSWAWRDATNASNCATRASNSVLDQLVAGRSKHTPTNMITAIRFIPSPFRQEVAIRVAS